jgi:hypothetical protein
MYKKIKREYIDTLQINGLTNLQQVYAVCREGRESKKEEKEEGSVRR